MPIIRPKQPFPFLVRASESAGTAETAASPAQATDSLDTSALQAYVQNYSIPGDVALNPLGTENQTFSAEFTQSPKNWTWLNQGASTIQYTLSRAIITPEAGGAGLNALRVFAPATFLSTPWCVRVRFINWSTRVGDGGGIAAYNASNGRVHAIQIYRRLAVTGDPYTETWAVNDYAAITSTLPNASRWGPTVQDIGRMDGYFQMRCDGTSLFFDWSPDNARFVNIQSTTLATYIGAVTRVGIIGNCPNATPTTGSLGYDWFRAYGNANLNQ